MKDGATRKRARRTPAQTLALIEAWARTWEDPSGLSDPLHVGERQGLVRAKQTVLSFLRTSKREVETMSRATRQHETPATLRPYAGTLAEILNAVRIAAMDHVICGAVHGPHVCTKEPHRGDGFAHECVAPESITNSAIVYARWPQ